VALLIDAGASVNQRNLSASTALHLVGFAHFAPVENTNTFQYGATTPNHLIFLV
jgi:hypothetical protein